MAVGKSNLNLKHQILYSRLLREFMEFMLYDAPSPRYEPIMLKLDMHLQVPWLGYVYFPAFRCWVRYVDCSPT